MRPKCILSFSLSILFGTAIFGIAHGASNNVTYVKAEVNDATLALKETPDITETAPVEEVVIENEIEEKIVPEASVHTVPFYSQFTDITAPEWRKIGCGIASLAMLIDFYTDEDVNVDTLLHEGITANAYTGDAGWSHAGLIGLAKAHGLSGEAVYMNDISMANAFSKLEEELKEGPVMASVHYTFTPTNPIPHLVIITGVDNGEVHYNDPAEKSGDGFISIQQFQSAWKKRYIAIR